MADTCTLSNGENIAIFSDRDITDVIERFCGYDFAKYVGSLLEDRTEIINTLDKLTSNDYDKLNNCNTERNNQYDFAQNHYDAAIEYLSSIRNAEIKIAISQAVDDAIEEVFEMKETLEKLYEISGDIHEYAEGLYNNMCELI